MRPSRRISRAGRRLSSAQLVGALTVFLLICTGATAAPGDKTEKASPRENKNTEPHTPVALQDSAKKSLHQDAQAAREKYWKRTLEEIRSLTVIKPQKERSKSEADQALNGWKLFSTSKKPERYNGYFSWDRLLQEWSDDIQEYLDKIEVEGKGQYSMSTFGVPKAKEQTSVDEKEDIIEAETVTSPVSEDSTSDPIPDTTQNDNKDDSRPVPAPRKDGEAVLPHTDISDKSKRIWIVTTAALPWMTGTAVNPLLRAAYMSTGRKAAGGGVTLMLPWLERQEDQNAVYGQGKTFETPEDQEAHIRGWLKNTANMQEASEELDIRWYTAWQNKAENSLYSMGDIVATIPEDEVDIMVLEEPEHLNW